MIGAWKYIILSFSKLYYKSTQVTSDLVAAFVSMTGAEDLQQTCAFQFPAVVLTVGRERSVSLKCVWFIDIISLSVLNVNQTDGKKCVMVIWASFALKMLKCVEHCLSRCMRFVLKTRHHLWKICISKWVLCCFRSLKFLVKTSWKTNFFQFSRASLTMRSRSVLAL